MTKRYKIGQNQRQARTRLKTRRVSPYPRLSVFRSNKSIYAQIIDDQKGETRVSATSLELTTKIKSKIEEARAVGKVLAQRALKAGIKKIVFDRGSYKFHGRVKALAEGAREGGLNF